VQFLTAGIGGGSETDPSYHERRKVRFRGRLRPLGIPGFTWVP
jgi:hypothetical protein